MVSACARRQLDAVVQPCLRCGVLTLIRPAGRQGTLSQAQLVDKYAFWLPKWSWIGRWVE